MRFGILIVTLAFALMASAVGAQQSVQLDLVRTAPSSGFVLPRYGSVYMEVAYRSDVPLRLQAQAYRDGASLDAGQMMNASVLHPAGSGRALVWVGYSQPAIIDEIRITAYDDAWQPLAVLPVARPAQWLSKPAKGRSTPPGWVANLIEAEKRLAEQSQFEYPQEESVLDSLLFTLIGLAIPGYLVLQTAALLTQRGAWRIAAALPLLVTGPALLHALAALAAGSNLWPILVIFTAPVGCLYLLLLLGFRGVRGALAAA